MLLKRRGFTLVEVLAVVVVLTVISSIVIPSVFTMVRNGKQRSFEVLISSFEENGKLYISQHRTEVENSLNLYNYYTFSLKDLQKEGLIKAPVNDPRTDEPIDLNKLLIVTRLEDKTLSVCFEDRGCFIPTPLVNKLTANIVTGTSPGLHEDAVNNFYYYKGSNPNNWIEFDGYLWRIVKINSDNTLKIVFEGKKDKLSTEENGSVGTSIYASGLSHDYDDALEIKSFLQNWYNTNISDENKDKVASKNWCDGNVTYNVLGVSKAAFYSNECISQTANQVSVGMLTGSEYLSASSNASCINTVNTECSLSNYLKKAYEYYTMTGVDNPSLNEIWRVGVILGPVSSTNSIDVRPVVNLISGVLSDRGDGTFDNPYQIKELVNPDQDSPVITMNGSSVVMIEKGTNYTDAGANAIDTEDGNLTNKISVISNVNTSVEGTYTVTYIVSDKSGNVGRAQRIVKVYVTQPQFYSQSKGVNKPVLATGMTPVKWNGNTWVNTTDGDPDWYNYTLTDHKWANAKTADGSMWVWIPRYIYKISNGWHSSMFSGGIAGAGTVNIKFSIDYDDTLGGTVALNTGTGASASNNTWTNHPAFTFGGIELPGIWVAKFEASGTTSALDFKPNVASLRNVTVNNIFTATRNMEKNSRYGWGTSGVGIDTHLAKNVEWGAVAYLTQSTYGKSSPVWMNNSSTFITGCASDSETTLDTYAGCEYAYDTSNGGQASTTGNIYGIYDMAGGSYEYTSAYVNNSYADDTGLSLYNADSRYKDVYAVTTDDLSNNYSNAQNKKGDAIYETSGAAGGEEAWYFDEAFMPYGSDPWFLRGGGYDEGADAGIFNFYSTVFAGDNEIGFRATIAVIKNEEPLITITGNNPINVLKGTTYTDAGATATDEEDGIITSNIQTTSNVNTSVDGTYVVTYSVTDSGGNTVTSSRTVNVVQDYNGPGYIASKGVNGPVLATGMTPIKWNGSSWVDTTINDPYWYNYTSGDKQWANVRTADGSLWVWIPRYAYQIATNYHTGTVGTINTKFLQSNTLTASDGSTVSTTATYSGSSQTNYIAHPAFKFGTVEVTGIWIAKFEASNSGSNNVKSIYNAISWRNISANEIFNKVRSMEINSIYGWGTSGVGIDTHMMKNTEWGAAAYLSQSTYGKNAEIWVNPANDYTTGCAGDSVSSSATTGCLRTYATANGQQASTTGNVYGIYDMSGGAWEYMAAYISNAHSNLTTYGSNILNADVRYKNVYTVTTDSDANNYANAINVKGDAVYETSSGTNGSFSWYSDYAYMIRTDQPCFVRGGPYNHTSGAGSFQFNYGTCDVHSTMGFRPIVIVNNEAPTITIAGSNPVTITRGSAYTDAGATATDPENGNVTASIQTTSNVNISVEGTYTVTYTAVDSNGNTTTAERTVNVIRDSYAGPNYISSKGVNGPVLATGMTPIKWDGSAWVNTDIYDVDWYNYTASDKKWANAKTTDGSMWVWIPRYAYQIATNYHTSTAGTINTKFLQNNTLTASDGSTVSTTATYSGSSQTNYIAHPAFKFGTVEVTGIWVAKFESSGTTSAVDIKPNVAAIHSITANNSFTASRNMETNSRFGWGTSGVGIDTHLVKNTEWGAIAYLSQSTYGKNAEIWINNSNTFTTGCAGDSVSAAAYAGCQYAYNTTNGQQASTTGNVYGIYDINGCSWERISAYINNGNANLNNYGANIVSADIRYKDVYTVTTDDQATNYANAANKKGDAIYETSGAYNTGSGSWYGDYSQMAYTSSPFFSRGGWAGQVSGGGAFGFLGSGGNTASDAGFRPILIVNNEAPTITITGSPIIAIVQGSTYTDAGATASDPENGNLTSSIQTTSNVNPSVIGTYTVTYNVSDSNGNASSPVVRTVLVNATAVPPTVAFGTNGSTTWAKTRSTTVTVTDNSGSGISTLKYLWNTSTTAPTEASFSSTFTSGNTLSSAAGVTGGYYLWILAKDNGNNTTITRTNVFNLDNTPPVLTITGSNPASVSVGGTYSDAGATATDANSGISGSVTSTGTVNTSVGGAYTITYNVSDAAGNTTSLMRTVYVGSSPTYSYTAANKAPVYGISGGTYPPTASWTGLVNANGDDSSTTVPLPFPIFMYGKAYTTVYVGSNSYLTFGGSSTVYSGLSASNPPYEKLFFGAADNSYQRVSYYSSTQFVRIRYEGTAGTSGTLGSPNIVVEITIFNPYYVSGYQTMIEMLVGTHNRTTGTSMIANYNGTASTAYALAASTSYIFFGNNTGNSFQIFSSNSATNTGY